MARVVDRLLASPHYGERWGRYWLDVARYGEDQATLSSLGSIPMDIVTATGSCGPTTATFLTTDSSSSRSPATRSTVQTEQTVLLPSAFSLRSRLLRGRERHDQYDDRIDTLTRGFLGLTVACARCHDHKFDPIPTADYYALEGVFASTEYVEEPAAPKEAVDAYKSAQSAIQAKDKAIATYLKAEGERLKVKVQGKDFKPVERMLPEEGKKKLKGLRAELDDLKKKAPPKFPVIHTLGEASRAIDSPVLIRGNPTTPGAKVPRHFLTVLNGDRQPFAHGSGRLDLARAIASGDNPLTARVMVNRVWQHHFGRGLVGSSSNFGVLGDRPSHPELLDWLAHRFIASGWSLKVLHREIMLSATYRQSSRLEAEQPHQGPRKRLALADEPTPA